MKSLDQIEIEMIELLTNIADAETGVFKSNESIWESGLDSLMALELVVRTNRIFQVKLTKEILEKNNTPHKLAVYINSKMGNNDAN